MSKLHKNIVVSGIVQGVGFRYQTVRIAQALGISGYVKNQPDGTVFIEAEAPEMQLDKFIYWCTEGPPHAQVENVEITDGPLKNFAAFTVK